MTEEEHPFEIQQAILLTKINETLGNLESTSKWKKPPESREEYAPLRGKKVLMVDDVMILLQAFVPDLMVATAGNASFLKYTNESVEEIVRIIEGQNPEVVLVDYNLSEHVKGSALVRELRKVGFRGDVIGFSSDPDTSDDFMSAGASGCIPKEGGFPELSVKELAQLMDRK